MNYEEKLKEKFYKKFAGSVWSGLPVSKESFDDIWSFISQSFSNYKKELVEEIEKLDRPSHIDDTEGYYDLAIEDILSLLQKDKEISK